MIDDAVLRAWLTGRSLARRLPPPVEDHGGFRIDTQSATEDARWVFPRADRRMTDLAHAIASPRTLLKACTTGAALAAILPRGWHVDDSHWFMRSDTPPPPPPPIPAGYAIRIDRDGPIYFVSITAPDDMPAASGHGAETDDAFVYDRIETLPDHRRKGLGHTIMATLHSVKSDRSKPELLVATQAGRLLYAWLGWAVLSPYASASFAPS